jgi:hypothetical protein
VAVQKQTYFDSYWGPGWPNEDWLAHYFLTEKGRRDFFAAGNDSWGLTAEGVDGTDHLLHLKGRVDVHLTIQGHPDLGVLLQWRKTGRQPVQSYYSKGDLTKLHQWVQTVHGDRMPVGLFIPFDTAWPAVKEFMDRNGVLPEAIAWINGSELPATAFPPPIIGPGMVIASRTLTLRGDNLDAQICIRISAPRRWSDGAWFCHYEIDWPDKRSTKDIGGFDSMQALIHALQIIGAEIYSSNYHKAGQLFWDDPGKGYGFPVAPTLRDLLQGDDAKYY